MHNSRQPEFELSPKVGQHFPGSPVDDDPSDAGANAWPAQYAGVQTVGQHLLAGTFRSFVRDWLILRQLEATRQRDPNNWRERFAHWCVRCNWPAAKQVWTGGTLGFRSIGVITTISGVEMAQVSSLRSRVHGLVLHEMPSTCLFITVCACVFGC